MVKAWKEQVVIPTYEIGKPEKNPIFLEKRVYQGSSGVVYPYPVIEKVCDEKVDKTYNAVYLENEYIKVMILPELGGRVQMAYDKIKQRHFIYYNRVIKPALVGLAGPWISGGIEFNWPQHHRPSTYMPIDCRIEENNDGSVTVWVSEMERMFHQKGMAGFTLRPGCAYLEIKGRLYNRTEVPQTFLWWANPAVAVNDHYQSVFPPDIHAVFDHGKRAVSSFPIATGTYYKMDYSAGVDISNYKNIYVPTSYMAVNSRFDFEGGYENDTKAGMLHVASHHVSPGKKQWTWGNGDFGRAWDRNLTDEDGPYIELMAGVYTENQPDFTWLQPYEEKSFVQYFMPYRELGVVKQASRDLLLNVEPQDESGRVNLKLFATSHQEVQVVLRIQQGEVYYDNFVRLSPEKLLDEMIDIQGTDFTELSVSVMANGRELLTWQSEPDEVKPLPDAAEAALLPQEIKTTEQLYLTGLHLEQYRHATYNPVDYYEEALRRDPLDVRCNNALGLWYIRKGQFAKAENYLLTAVQVLQRRNPNPYDGEPIYNLGLALKYQGRFNEAYNRFHKACWNAAWQDAGYFSCAQISVLQGRWEEALDEVERSLVRNWHNHKARALKVAILRHLGRTAEALEWIEASLQIDTFNFGCRYERCLLTGKSADWEEWKELMRDEAHNYDEVALDYCAAGLWQEAADLWQMAIGQGAVTPLTFYYLGWCLTQGCLPGASEAFEQGRQAIPDYCFPNRLEAVLALQCAIDANGEDARAPYYLGNLYYDKRQYEVAMSLWKKSALLDATFPTVQRNLALGYFNKENQVERAVECMEQAFRLDSSDARVLMELDQLYKRLGRPHQERLDFLQQYPDLIAQRDDLILEEATLLNQVGRYREAMTRIDNHLFHPWEGGEGKVSAQYQYARVELAKEALSQGKPTEAIRLLEECLQYPHNLGEGKLYGAQENDFYYFLGEAYTALGDTDKAREAWMKGTEGPTEPAAALYYNDAKPDKIFYAALCYRCLGLSDKASGLFYKLINYGEKHIFDEVRMDYFAVSLPDLLIWDDDLNVRNRVHCHYMLSLGNWGIGEQRKALHHLQAAETLNNNHAGIATFRTFIERE